MKNSCLTNHEKAFSDADNKNKSTLKCFYFADAFNESLSNAFLETTKLLVDELLEGRNTCLIAQEGSSTLLFFHI